MITRAGTTVTGAGAASGPHDILADRGPGGPLHPGPDRLAAAVADDLGHGVGDPGTHARPTPAPRASPVAIHQDLPVPAAGEMQPAGGVATRQVTRTQPARTGPIGHEPAECRRTLRRVVEVAPGRCGARPPTLAQPDPRPPPAVLGAHLAPAAEQRPTDQDLGRRASGLVSATSCATRRCGVSVQP